MFIRFLFSTLLFPILLFSFNISIPVHASDEDTFSFDEPVLRGTGCPGRSSSVIMSPDQTTMSILFDQFEAAVPHNNGHNDNEDTSGEPGREDRLSPFLNRKVCHIYLAANLPQGHFIQSVDISLDFRGFTHVEKGGRALFRSLFMEHSGLGRSYSPNSLIEEKTWVPRTDLAISQEWFSHNNKNIPLNSPCSRREDRKIKLHVQNVLTAAISRIRPNHGPMPSASITLDSADLTGRMNFKLHIKRCQNTTNPTHPSRVDRPVPPTPVIRPTLPPRPPHPVPPRAPTRPRNYGRW